MSNSPSRFSLSLFLLFSVQFYSLFLFLLLLFLLCHSLSAFPGPVEDFTGLKCVFLGLYLTLFSMLLQFLWIKQISAASGSIQGFERKFILSQSYKNHIRAMFMSYSVKALNVCLLRLSSYFVVITIFGIYFGCNICIIINNVDIRKVTFVMDKNNTVF